MILPESRMIKLKNEIIISMALVLIAVLSIGYNIFSVEMQKVEDQRQLDENDRLEREMLENIKLEEAREIAEYYQKYRPLKDEFIEKVNLLSEKIKNGVTNTAVLKELTMKRLDEAGNYKEKLTQIGNIPDPLKTFFSYELEFIESDIKTINLILSYYGSESYSDFNDNAIEKLYENTEYLLLKAEEELHRVYSQYELEYLLEESS